MARPPFLRIADGLRARIEAGELRPGDRIPSTRELARTHGVALATAARALRSLVDAGVVRAVPRIGTVVASGERRAPASRELSRERIVNAAIAIADAEGLPALSLRGLASKLDAPVMSLYRHVASKDALLSLMTDTALGEEPLPGRHLAWRPALEGAARASWRAVRRHPWLARTTSLSRPLPLPNAIRWADYVLGALASHGLDAATRMHLHIVLHAFVLGLAVNLETEADAIATTGMGHDAWIDTQVGAFEALARTGRYPAFAAVLEELDAGFDLDFDALFEQGLGALLDGFQRTIERARRRR